ncbi:META domain-containing protein [Streptomyces cavernicola]|uniref:META domain-containing protein n=1 Tax=Streptomyces cavernicola TaxID=3043613 RepID=A0ABT6S3F6_9ACTN|nr:META domain-containing protein [Streptomyces sp. B-S-A6]MDI3402617.1 META domain-containing protein [Streptomyces sp. B-S-A6]
MHTQRKTLSTVGAVSAVAALGLLTACGADKTSAGDAPAEPSVPVTGTHWTVDSVTAGGKKIDAPGTKAHVAFDKKGRATGNFGCNGFGGTASVKGDTITVDKIAKTEMSCGDEIDKLETTLTEALKGKLKASVKGDKLTLTTAKGDSITLTSEPPAELAGTKWLLKAVVEKEVATSLPESASKADKAHLIFDEKAGTVHGNLGCNEVNAKATVTDGKIELGTPRLTRKMCDGEVMKAEQNLAKLFGSTVTYEIDHRTLHLTGKDGLGLNAEAAAKK